MVFGFMSRALGEGRRILQVAKSDRGILFLHLGGATGLMGFCMTDQIPLRSCSIVYSAASIYFTLSRKVVLSYVPAVWSSLFISVNAFRIGTILLSRMDTTLTELEEEVYTKHFLPFGMRPRQFKKLLNAATTKTYAPKSVIETETMFPSNEPVKLLTKGEATVFKNKKHLFTINADHPTCFIGDMSLLELEDYMIRVEPFVSTVIAEDETVHTLEWDQEYLLKVLREKSELSTQLRSVLTNSVLRKLVDIAEVQSKSKYITLLEAFAADGVIDDVEKTVLMEYKENHNIDDATQARGLATLGWTEEDFKRGRKQKSLTQSLIDLQEKLEKMIESKEQQEDVENMMLSIRKSCSKPLE